MLDRFAHRWIALLGWLSFGTRRNVRGLTRLDCASPKSLGSPILWLANTRTILVSLQDVDMQCQRRVALCLA